MSVQDNVAALDGSETVSVSKNGFPMNASVQDFATYMDAEIQFLTAASGNYIVPAGKSQLTGYMTAGGGGGGGVANANASAAPGVSGVFMGFVMSVTPGQVIPFTCGALGTGGAAGNNNGNTGGDTTFGSLTAKGGPGGTGSASGNASGQALSSSISVLNGSKVTPTPALFQTLVGFSQNSAGVTGNNGTNTGTFTPWMIAPVQNGANSAGGSASGYGGAGAGATSTTGGAFAGGDGTPGAIMIVAR